MKRIIKNEFEEYSKNNFKNLEIGEIPANSQKIHPITLNWIDNRKSINPLCLTKPHVENSNYLIMYKDYKCTNTSSNYKSFLYIPPIGITAADIIQIYNINSIDSLQTYVNNNINEINILSLNRVVNSWIRINFDTIKMYNNFLEKIYKKLLEKYLSSQNWQYVQTRELDKEIKKFIDYWFDKNNSIGFNFNLLEDLELYLLKTK